jgi:hypothetical protein
MDDRCEKADAKDISEIEDCVVSKLLMEGAWNIELVWLESLLDPVLRDREREWPELGAWSRNGVLAMARIMAVFEAASFSGGEYFQRSRGVSNDRSIPGGIVLVGISMAPGTGELLRGEGRIFPLRLAFASQLQI